MKRTRIPISHATLLWAALLLAPAFLTACQHDEVVAPATTTTGDDHGSGGNGSDDPPGDDHGGD